MANKVNNTPNIPSPVSLRQVQDVSTFITQLVSSLSNELSSYAQRLNNSIQADGTEIPSAPIVYKEYAKASLPSVGTFKNGMIIVTDDVGGRTPAFSDGTNWRRTADRNVIS